MENYEVRWYNYITNLLLGEPWNKESIEKIRYEWYDNEPFARSPKHSWIKVLLPLYDSYKVDYVNSEHKAIYHDRFHEHEYEYQILLTPEQLMEIQVYQVYKQL